MQDSVDQVLNCDELLYLMPKLLGLGGCGFAFCLEFGALCLPGFYWKWFTIPGEFAFGQVVAAEFWLVVLLKLFPAIFCFKSSKV